MNKYVKELSEIIKEEDFSETGGLEHVIEKAMRDGFIFTQEQLEDIEEIREGITEEVQKHTSRVISRTGAYSFDFSADEAENIARQIEEEGVSDELQYDLHKFAIDLCNHNNKLDWIDVQFKAGGYTLSIHAEGDEYDNYISAEDAFKDLASILREEMSVACFTAQLIDPAGFSKTTGLGSIQFNAISDEAYLCKCIAEQLEDLKNDVEAEAVPPLAAFIEYLKSADDLRENAADLLDDESRHYARLQLAADWPDLWPMERTEDLCADEALDILTHLRAKQ